MKMIYFIYSVLPLFFISFPAQAQFEIEKESLRQPAREWKEYKKESYTSLGCTIETRWFTGWDPATQKASGREVHIFRPENPGKDRPVILLPPTGGMNFLDRQMGKYFCSRNVTFYILAQFDGFADKDYDLRRHDRQIRGNTAALKELIQWIHQPVNLMGASLGALYAAAAMGADPQIEKVVLTVGGVDLAGILTDSQLESVTVQKINRKEIYHLTSDADYLQLMKKSIHYDPGIFLSEEKNSERFLLFLSSEDTDVPTPYQKSLAEQLPKAKKTYFEAGHLWTVIRTYLFHREEIFNFFSVQHSEAKN